MDAFTILDIEGNNNDEIKLKVPKVAVEITRGCQRTQDEMFARYEYCLAISSRRNNHALQQK